MRFVKQSECEVQPTFINLYRNDYSQEFHYYPFTVKLDKYVGSCNILNDLSKKVYAPNKTEDLNLNVFNMITGINESKTSTKHDKCQCECKKRHICEKDYAWNPDTCNWESGEYLASIMDDSAIMCDEVIESYKEDTEAKSYDKTNFNEKKATCKGQNFYILLAFLLITIVLLIAVSIYCYLITYWAKQKHLVPFKVTNNKRKEIIY